jgi:GPH family glycoside/pentoside/hexuronide:cation symporter
MLPEISQDYNERTNISGYKQAFAVIGTLLGAGAAMPLMALFAGRTAGYVGMSAIFGLLAALSLFATFFSVREPPRVEEPQRESMLLALKDAFTNKPFLVLLSAWFTNSAAVAVMESMLVYYYKYIFRDEKAVTLAMIALLLVTIATIPFWVWLSKKTGKRPAYMLGMTLTLLAVVLFAFSADRLGEAGALAYMVLAGFGFSSHYVLPWSMAPDTIEFSYARSGVRREGIYYSIWTFTIAVGGAFAGFLVGQSLALSGYVPDAAQTAASILGIRLLIGPLPAVLLLLGNLFLAFYPLNRQRYEQVQAAIRERDGKGA